MTRSIGVVTVARSDFGIYLPLLRMIERESALELKLLVGGSHFDERQGHTIDEILAQGFVAAAKIDVAGKADDPFAIAEMMGATVTGFAHAYKDVQPDLVVVLGDRYEMHAAALAAVPFGIPIAHIHGGEITEGAFDDALRHSITKLSHLHFVSTVEHGRRVRQLGEEPWRVTVSGAPALDLISVPPISDEDLEQRIGMTLDDPPIVVTFHPVTLEWRSAEAQIRALIAALTKTGRPVVFTAPNADTGRNVVQEVIEEFVAGSATATMVKSLGSHAYFSLLRRAAAMAGNSSSGIIEAPSFGLPVVNIGSRQDGRVRAANVIDCDPDPVAIYDALQHALSPRFRSSVDGLVNPYGDGKAAPRITGVLRDVPLDETLLRKRFVDLPEGSA